MVNSPPSFQASPSVSVASSFRRVGFGLTDLGRKRTSNEDAYFLDDTLGLYVVADGMGGHAAGEVASQESVETVYGMVKRQYATLKALTEPLDPTTPARPAA